MVIFIPKPLVVEKSSLFSGMYNDALTLTVRGSTLVVRIWRLQMADSDDIWRLQTSDSDV